MFIVTVALCACAEPDHSALDGIGPAPGVTEVWRIDGLREDLVPIRSGGFAAGPDHVIAVGQALDNVVRLFDRGGSHVGTIGRRGEGPGEFSSIVRVGWMKDTLWVWDGRLQRVTFVDRDLTFLGSVLLRVGSSALLEDHGRGNFVPHSPLAFIARDTLLVYGEVRGARAGDAVAVTTAAGRLLGIVADIMTPEDDRTIPLPGGGRMDGDPFATQPRFAVSTGGRYVTVARNHYDGASAGTFSVLLVSTAGDTVFRTRHTYTEVRIPARSTDSVRMRAAELLSSDHLQAFRRHAFIPHSYPPVDRLIVTDEPRVWVQLRTAEQHTHLVLDGTGQTLARVILPPGADIVAAHGDRVWVLVRDADDVESIVHYRVDVPSASSSAGD